MFLLFKLKYWADKSFVHVFPQEAKELFGQHNISDKFCIIFLNPPNGKVPKIQDNAVSNKVWNFCALLKKKSTDMF